MTSVRVHSAVVAQTLGTNKIIGRLVGQKISSEGLVGLFDKLWISQASCSVTLFSGGTGSNGLSSSLADVSGVDLSVLLNAYDDGKSTGKIRHDFNMLGPSDIAKNIVNLLDPQMEGSSAIKLFLGMRLSKSFSPAEHLESLRRITTCEDPGGTDFEKAFYLLPAGVRESFRSYLKYFYRRALRVSPDYDLRDFGVRNLVFTGVYMKNGRYNTAIEELSGLLGVRGRIILNDSQSLWLVALTEKGEFLASEAEIVDRLLEQEIDNTYLLAKPASKKEIDALGQMKTVEEKKRFLEERDVAIELSAEARIAMSADVLVFAPTTFSSSLAPTIKTKRFPSDYKSSLALKVCILNLVRERGKRTASEQLLTMESLFQAELRKDTFIHDLLDYVIVNTHGYRVDINGGKTHIPIDIEDLKKLGLNVIEADIEDSVVPGHHVSDKLAKLILVLQRLDRLNCCYREGCIVPKSSSVLERDRMVLENLLSNPLKFEEVRERVHNLGNRILGIRRLEEYSPISPVRIMIAAGGQSTRLKSEYPKALYPINGEPALLHLIRRVSGIDRDFIVLTNEDNDAAIRDTLSQAGINPNTVVGLPMGTGSSILVAEDSLDPSIKNVMIVWGDAANVRLSTMREALFIHEALGDPDVTMPTCWEGNPYAGIERDSDGNVIGIFQTKEDPQTRRQYGEHDASLFVVRRDRLFEGIKRLRRWIGESGLRKDIDLLQSFRFFGDEGAKMIAFAGADPRETQGFNTVAEAAIVETYQIELENGTRFSVPIEEELYRKKADLSASVDGTGNYSQDHQAEIMWARFTYAIEQQYRAAIFDVDENLTDLQGEVPPRMISHLLGFAESGIPVAFISGRLEGSLNKMLLSKLAEKAKKDTSLLQRFYAYPSVGALGFRLDSPDELLYDRKIPKYVLSAAMSLIRRYLLDFEDLYYVADHKITIMPHERMRQGNLLALINYLMEYAGIPLKARISSSIYSDASIILTSSDYGSEVHKGVALYDFSGRIGVDIDQIVKVGDRGGKENVDHEMLVGMGSFSSADFDPDSEDQIALPLVSNKKNLGAVEWLFPQLRFV